MGKRGVGAGTVSAKQRAAYEMRKNGATFDEIASALNCVQQTARMHVKRAERNGLEPLFQKQHRRPIDPNDPEAKKKIADGLGMFDAASGTFDMKVFSQVAASAGIQPRLAMALARRVEMHYGPVRQELKKLTLQERVDATNQKADMILSYIDEASIAGMNAKDLAVAYGVLVDKAQLLGGKPTQIFDFNMRRSLQVLMPEFLAEAKRRGITIEGEFHVDRPTAPTELSDRSGELERGDSMVGK